MKRLGSLNLISLLIVLKASVAYAQTDVLTQHNDLKRTGWNNQETSLTTSNVNTNSFGLLYSRAVDDQVYAQPLVVSGVTIPSVGVKNIVYVCTVNNTIYAFDADDGSVPAYWQVNFTPSGYRPPINVDMHPSLCSGNYFDFTSNIGLVGTPVIDKASNTIYFVTKIASTTPGVVDNHAWNGNEYSYTNAGFYQYLHAVDLSTGAEKFNGPVNITASVTAPGDGNVSGVITFDARRQFNRAGLVLSGGIVYIAYGGHCDWNPAHGWLLGYDATSLQQKIVFITTPNDGRGGIWMSGAAPAVDASGSLYFTTGNAYDDTVKYHDLPSAIVNRGESIVKVTPNAPDHSATAVTISSYFTPSNYIYLNSADLDFPIQVMLIPNTNMALTGCKLMGLYLMNKDNLGGFDPNTNHILQTVDIGSNAQQHSSFAYFGGSTAQYIYQFSENTLLQAYQVGASSLGTAITGNISGPTGGTGGFMSVSSNGADPATGILWVSQPVNGCNANSGLCQGILRAMKADDVKTELWNSTINPADNLGNYSKMNCPTIANGKVYVNTFSNKLMVYGLTSNNSCTSYPNVALHSNNSSAIYSASSNSGTAGNAFDGSTSTSWTAAKTGSGGGETASLTVNLGAKYDICKVVLHWGSNYGKAFDIEGSNDGTTFTTISSVTGNISLDNIVTFSTVSYQYIRMHGVTRNSMGSGYVVNEMEVYGSLTNLCTAPTGLAASNITENTATLSWNAVGTATSYNIQYRTSLVSSCVTRTTSSTSINISALTCGTGYTFTVQAVCPTGTSSQSTGTLTTSTCTATCGALHTRYFSADIGDIGVAGSSCLANNIYTLKGSGVNIGGTSDQFQFAFTNINGDEHVFAEVLTQDASSSSNKAGLMFRDSVSNTSRYAFIGTTRANGAVFAYRSTPGGSTTTITVPGITAPYWVELNKSGNLYKAYISPTGAQNTWTQVGSTVDLGFGSSPVYVGMAVTSANNSVLSTSTFGSFAELSGPLPVRLISFTGNNVNNKFIQLRWATSAEINSKYFDVQKSYNGTDFTTLTEVNAIDNSNVNQYYSAIDYHPGNGINFYRLREFDKDGAVSNSSVVAVKFGNKDIPQVTPNPFDFYFTVTAGAEPVKEVSVFDASGKMIRQIENSSNSQIITISSEAMARGIYIVKIKTSSQTYQQKLVKK